MVKTTCPKVTLLPSVIRSWQMGYVLPPVTSARRKTGCANRNFSVQRPSPVCESMARTTWVQGLFPLRNQAKG